jgi:hypothetical protein
MLAGLRRAGPWSNGHGKEGAPASQGSGRRSRQGDKEEPARVAGIPDTRGYPPGAGAGKIFSACSFGWWLVAGADLF